MTTRRFLLKVFVDGSAEPNNPPDCALLCLSKEALIRLAEMRKMAKELEARLRFGDDQWSAFRNFTVRALTPSFFCGASLLIHEEDEGLGEDSQLQVLIKGVDEEELLEITPGDAVCLDDLLSRERAEPDCMSFSCNMDYEFMSVDTGGIRWTGCVKHASYEVSTAEIPWSVLFPDSEKE